MINYDIEVINFEPVPGSTLLTYFNAELNELASNPKVNEIQKAKLILMHKRPPIGSAEYLYSNDIPMPGTPHASYKVCQIIVIIDNVECVISNYDESLFESAVDKVINEGLRRCLIYDVPTLTETANTNIAKTSPYLRESPNYPLG